MKKEFINKALTWRMRNFFKKVLKKDVIVFTLNEMGINAEQTRF